MEACLNKKLTKASARRLIGKSILFLRNYENPCKYTHDGELGLSANEISKGDVGLILDCKIRQQLGVIWPEYSILVNGEILVVDGSGFFQAYTRRGTPDPYRRSKRPKLIRIENVPTVTIL